MQRSSTRRTFLKTASLGVLGAAALTQGTPRVHAAESNTIRFALVGCGGRGGGALQNVMDTDGPVKLVALADVFKNRAANLANALRQKDDERGKIPEDMVFDGLDSYKNAIDALEPGDVVLLASTPVFRPQHVEYAVAKGLHVFMEKSFSTDSPQTRRLEAAVAESERKGLKVACGLMYRHGLGRQETIQRIHDGEIGELMHLRGFRMQGQWYDFQKRPDETETAYQIRAFHSFDWSGGNIFIDGCIHNFDIANWVMKDTVPVSALGFAATLGPIRTGQLRDNWYAEFEYADGTRLSSHTRFLSGCYNVYNDFAHGTKGSADLSRYQTFSTRSMDYKDWILQRGTTTWAYKEREPNAYQLEIDMFFDAIRNDKPYNEGRRAVAASWTALLSRAACDSGKVITMDEVMKSELTLCDVDSLSLDGEPPVTPNSDGTYPIPVPGADVVI